MQSVLGEPLFGLENWNARRTVNAIMRMDTQTRPIPPTACNDRYPKPSTIIRTQRHLNTIARVCVHLMHGGLRFSHDNWQIEPNHPLSRVLWPTATSIPTPQIFNSNRFFKFHRLMSFIFEHRLDLHSGLDNYNCLTCEIFRVATSSSIMDMLPI